jgi:hypothetical protein
MQQTSQKMAMRHMREVAKTMRRSVDATTTRLGVQVVTPGQACRAAYL